MAKVKRSELANMANNPGKDEAPATPEPVAGTDGAPQGTPESGTETAFTPVSGSTETNEVVRTLKLALGVVSALAVLLAVAVVVLVVRGTGSPTTEPGANPPADSVTPTATATPVFFTKYVQVNPTANPDAIVVEIHDDYQCPWCARAEEIYGDALAALSQSGDIDLRVHIRTMVGDEIIHNDSSERAGIAATCADKVGYFWAYHSTVFANQPEEGVGYPDSQLRDDFAAQAGITGQALTNFQTCYDTKATSDFVTAMETEATGGGISSTPTFLVNGLKVNFDLQANSATVTPINTADLLAGLKHVVGQ